MARGSIGIKRHCGVQFIDSKYLKPVEGVMSKLDNEVRILVEEVLESWISQKRKFYDDRIKELIGEFHEDQLSEVVAIEVENTHRSMGFSPKCLTELEDRMKAYTESCIIVKCPSLEPVKVNRDSDDPEDVVWEALHNFREGLLRESEKDEVYRDQVDEIWDDICHAMAVMSEDNDVENDIYDSRDGWQCLYKIAPVGYSLETRQSYCVVNVGDILWLDGEEVKVTSLSPPHKASSTGKIGCFLSNGAGSYEPRAREYFASVFNCQYVYSPLKLPVEG